MVIILLACRLERPRGGQKWSEYDLCWELGRGVEKLENVGDVQGKTDPSWVLSRAGPGKSEHAGVNMEHQVKGS